VKAAVYARVSTDRQETMNQLRELREFCARRGWEIAAEYVDEDVRGKADRKPELERLLRDAHERRFDVVAFWALDRLTRAGPDAAADVLARMEATGCEFVSYKDPALNTLGPWKRIVVDLLATIARFESDRTRERILAGLRTARENGRRLGRPPKDYRLNLEAVRAERTAGASWRGLAAKHRVPVTNLRRLLAACQNPILETGGGQGKGAEPP